LVEPDDLLGCSTVVVGFFVLLFAFFLGLLSGSLSLSESECVDE
jgi:hypothetical protein